MERRPGILGLALTLLLALACEPAETPNAPAPDAATEQEAAEGDEEGALDRIASEPLAGHVVRRYPASLEAVLERRFLRVLTSRNAFDFFIDRGARGGFQYEKVEAFTRFLNQRYPVEPGSPSIQFELIPVADDQLIPLLAAGAGDLIAARMTITPERAEQVAFSRPYRTVDEVLVTHDQTPPIDSLEGLSGRRVGVRRSSSYHASLMELDRQLVAKGLPPIRIELVEEELETERILSLVAARRLPYTVVDSMLLELATAIHPTLRVPEGLVLRQGGALAWATLPEAGAMLSEIDAFLAKYREGSLLGNLMLKRYFEAEARIVERLREDRESGLSPYDAIFREHAARFGLDWRLVAAIACQESRFDANARNRSGAVGLMQIKPSTAREPYVGVDRVSGPEHVSDNVRAGLKYLTWIKARYFDAEPGMRERDRLRMALAAYNAGPRTVLRARKRASARGLDPDRWFRHVELAMLELGRSEPVKYVSEINQRHLSYVSLGIE